LSLTCPQLPAAGVFFFDRRLVNLVEGHGCACRQPTSRTSTIKTAEHASVPVGMTVRKIKAPVIAVAASAFYAAQVSATPMT
jgi:hypothetical protein